MDMSVYSPSFKFKEEKRKKTPFKPQKRDFQLKWAELFEQYNAKVELQFFGIQEKSRARHSIAVSRFGWSLTSDH